ncbi:hypothetical protein OLF92_10965, partial [Streptococcus pneumoniae]|nr:hypothetical protein [Streptococcus pneumoniae]
DTLTTDTAAETETTVETETADDTETTTDALTTDTADDTETADDEVELRDAERGLESMLTQFRKLEKLYPSQGIRRTLGKLATYADLVDLP